MNVNSVVKGTFLAFCLIGMLVLPAAAAPSGQGTNTNTNVIDQGLSDELWNNNHEYRLREFDLHVERANSEMGILARYSIDTSQMQDTLSTISSKRSALETALTSEDRESLKTINEDLQSLWKQFLEEMKETIKAHYPDARGAAKTGAARTSGAKAATNLFPAGNNPVSSL
jgi:hypothetical protein